MIRLSSPRNTCAQRRFLLSGAVAAAVAVAMGSLSGPGALAAQEPESFAPPPMHGGGHLLIAQPQGEFAEYVDLGIGIGGFVRIPIDEAELLSLRADLGALAYGNETRRVCLVNPCLVEADLTTSNNIFVGHLGPEIGVPLGGRGRLYGHLGGGFSYFATTSTLDDDRSNEAIASTTNFSDFGFAWNAGTGLQLAVSSGRTPVAIDLGVDYQGNGMREYLTEGDITVGSDGSVEFNPRRSDADVVLFRIGVSVGIRPS